MHFSSDIDAFAFLPGQEKALIASSGGFLPVDYRGEEKWRRFGSYKSSFISLSVTANGKQLAAASADGTVAVYDLST